MAAKDNKEGEDTSSLYTAYSSFVVPSETEGDPSVGDLTSEMSMIDDSVPVQTQFEEFHEEMDREGARPLRAAGHVRDILREQGTYPARQPQLETEQREFGEFDRQDKLSKV